MKVVPAGHKIPLLPTQKNAPSPNTAHVKASTVSVLWPRLGDAFVDSAPPKAPPVAPPSTSTVDKLALKTQRVLSITRRELGRAQLELENRNFIQKGLDAITRGDDAQEKRVETLKDRVSRLEKVEKAQPSEAVEKARLTVFLERMGQLEKTLGKSAAATLARQTYYNSDIWNKGRGTSPASEGSVNAAGLPHVPGYIGGEAVGGYGGLMRTPDGQAVDMGHVASALDWQVNKNSLPFTVQPTNYLPLSLVNPFNLQTVTLTGDVASAIKNTAAGANEAARADKAIQAEGDEDWRGDIDGLNLAHRLREQPGQGLTRLLNDYYGQGEYKNRIDEFATHGRYVKRDGQGQPLRDAQGHYLVDKNQLAREAGGFALLLSKGFSVNNPAGAVVEAWVRWFNQAQDSARLSQPSASRRGPALLLDA